MEYGGTPGRDGLLSYNDVIINEVLTHTDPPASDSIELYNTTGLPIDIGGWYLSDSSANYEKFRIPDDTIIAAHGYPFSPRRISANTSPSMPTKATTPGCLRPTPRAISNTLPTTWTSAPP